MRSKEKFGSLPGEKGWRRGCNKAILFCEGLSKLMGELRNDDDHLDTDGVGYRQIGETEMEPTLVLPVVMPNG
jgi:hypothetical protein